MYWIVRLMMHFIVVDNSEKFMFGFMTSTQKAPNEIRKHNRLHIWEHIWLHNCRQRITWAVLNTKSASSLLLI